MLPHITIGIVVILIIVSIVVVGSPQEARKVKFDEKRVQDLESMYFEIINSYSDEEELPKNVEELTQIRNIHGQRALIDPETGEPYEYIKTGEKTFTICASFTTKNKEKNKEHGYSFSRRNIEWIHDTGRVCFEKSIDTNNEGPLIKRETQI